MSSDRIVAVMRFPTVTEMKYAILIPNIQIHHHHDNFIVTMKWMNK